MKIKYREIRMGTKNKNLLANINRIIDVYKKDGYVLTLRQLYYQLVKDNVIPNRKSEYGKLSILIKEGRMSGIVDWDAIEDRTRGASVPSAWSSPASILDSVIYSYRKNRQKGQKTYIEVWVEKDALSGVLKRVTEPLGVPIVVNKGYSSATAMHEAYKRFKDASVYDSQNTVVIYLGDFDPSGLDMIRDITNRIGEFISGGDYPTSIDFEIVPIALTLAQIKKYKLPKNPAKMADPRADKYVAEHGINSYEVDALTPQILHSLLDGEIRGRMDMNIYDAIILEEKIDLIKLENVRDDFKNDNEND